MMDSGLTSKPRRSRGIRHQPRDWRIYHHLRCRKLSTEQVAKLEFPDEYGQPRERAPRSRLYLLMKEGSYLTNRTDLKGVGTVWKLTREGFRVMRESPSEAYPAPLDPDRARHLIATNDVYVELVRMLRGLLAIDDEDWKWVPEPLCHRRYDVSLEARRQRRAGAGVGRLLKPDAEVVLFEEVVFFIERRTAWAKRKAETLHDKSLATTATRTPPSGAPTPGGRSSSRRVIWSATVSPSWRRLRSTPRRPFRAATALQLPWASSW
jgi:hypothetical protein